MKAFESLKFMEEFHQSTNDSITLVFLEIPGYTGSFELINTTEITVSLFNMFFAKLLVSSHIAPMELIHVSHIRGFSHIMSAKNGGI